VRKKDGAEGEAPIVGADAVALAVAMDTAKQDPELARKAGNYLDEQHALVKLQIKHFDEERHLAIAAAKRKRYLDRLRIVGATMLAALGVAVTGAFIMFVRDAAHDTGVVLDAASTPAPMTDLGLNGAALANELIGRLDRIHSIVAKHSITRVQLARRAAAAALTHDVALSRQLFQQSVDVVPPDTEDELMARWRADVEDNDWTSALGDAQQLVARQERGKSEHPVKALTYEFTESTLSSMFETARAIIESSLPLNLTRRERRLAFAKRLYAGELPDAALLAFAEWNG
jgi:hypothetical protein